MNKKISGSVKSPMRDDDRPSSVAAKQARNWLNHDFRPDEIDEATYYLAEQRGFNDGDALRGWLHDENESSIYRQDS
jgi:hypothetical protein